MMQLLAKPPSNNAVAFIIVNVITVLDKLNVPVADVDEDTDIDNLENLLGKEGRAVRMAGSPDDCDWMEDWLEVRGLLLERSGERGAQVVIRRKAKRVFAHCMSEDAQRRAENQRNVRHARAVLTSSTHNSDEEGDGGFFENLSQTPPPP